MCNPVLMSCLFLWCILYVHITHGYEQGYLCEHNELVTDFDPSDCPPETYYIPDLEDNCIPKCEHRQGLSHKCDGSFHCAPGLKCYEAHCRLNKESCAHFNFVNTTKPFSKPICLADGTYAPKQCKGEPGSGRCFCYDPTGKRIFGQSPRTNSDEMSCACSLRHWELSQSGRSDVTLHCDAQGNYEPLQCDSGACWCAHPHTGHPLYTVVPDTMFQLLPCYDKKVIGEQYLRVCESQKVAQVKISLELARHGATDVIQDFLMCDWDGAYGAYTIKNNLLQCTWRDGSLMGYPSNSTEMAKITCNCARDKKLYEDSGMIFRLECETNGNYKQVQQSQEKFYCVDSDGFATTNMLNTSDTSQCPDY